MKYKCIFSLALTFVMMLLFYCVDSSAAIAAEQNPESTAEAEPEQTTEPVTEAESEQATESVTEAEPEQATEPVTEAEPGQNVDSAAASVGVEQNIAVTSLSEPAPDLVSTGQALTEWLESHKNTGGTVRLADHVVLDDEYYSYCPNGINMPSVFVDTDKYTITVTGEVDLLSDGNLIFSGQPDGKSIFYVAEKGVLSMQGVAVESEQCALWQEEGAGLVVGDCHISGSIHYADIPFVMDQNPLCVVVEKGQTVNDVLPAQISCTVNRQGKLTHNEWVPLAWNLEGYEKQQEERRRFQMQGSFLHAASAEPALCTVAYNDYPLTFTDVKASVSGSMYMFQGWYTKTENLPITVMSEYSFDGENWLMYEESNVTGTYGSFFIAVNSEQCDRAAHPNIYIRLQWDDNGTRYFSNVLCYAAGNLEYVEDIGGSRGGGTSITNPPDSPQKSIGSAFAKSEEQDQNANHNTNLGNTESEAPADISQTEKEVDDINPNVASGGQASNAGSQNAGTEQTSYSAAPNNAKSQPVYEESKTGSTEQSPHAESKNDRCVGNADNLDMKENISRSNSDAIVIATGFVLLSSIAGIAGFCFHSRLGTKR